MREVHSAQARWAGRNLYLMLHICVDAQRPLHEAHEVAEQVRHAIFHNVPEVVQVDIHVDPFGDDASAYHSTTNHHVP